MKKYVKSVLCIVLSISFLALLFAGCKQKPKEDLDKYAATHDNSCFASDEDAVYFSRHQCLELTYEKENKLTDLTGHVKSELYDTKDYKRCIYLYDGYLYYTTNYSAELERIKIDNPEKPEVVLTNEEKNFEGWFDYFTVFNNRIYFSGSESSDDGYINYIRCKDLKTGEIETVLFEKINGGMGNFFVNQYNIVFGNYIYNIESKELKILNESFFETKNAQYKWDNIVHGIGIIDNVYYCSVCDENSGKQNLYSIDLSTFETKELLTFGDTWIEPRLCGDKILFLNLNEKNAHCFECKYYDLSNQKMVTVFDKSTDCHQDPLMHDDFIYTYDCYIFKNYFYVHYGNVIVRHDIRKKNHEEVLSSLTYDNKDGSKRCERFWEEFNPNTNYFET